MGKRNISYKGYTVKELLDDDFFIQSMLHPTPESEVFWESAIEENIIFSEEYEKACDFLQVVKKPGKVMGIREKGSLWAAIEIRNKENLRLRIKRRNIILFSVAATFLLIMGTFVSLKFVRQEVLSQDIFTLAGEIKPIISNSNSIQLIVAGERIYEMEEKTAEIFLNDKGKIQVNSEMLEDEYSNKNRQTEVRYNQLIIPHGKHSKLTLSDGTMVYVNSGSRVIFPEVFTSKEREIFVDGEVYLDVKHDAKSPFIVRTNKMKVEVLGTSFNVSAYEDEQEQSVVLVSGSVVVCTYDNRETCLLPNQKMTYTNDSHLVTVVDVNQYTSWKEGYLICNEEAFPFLMRKLSRYYGRAIECDSSLSTYLANGKLDLKNNFENVMNGLKEIFPIEILYHENLCQIVRKSN